MLNEELNSAGSAAGTLMRNANCRMRTFCLLGLLSTSRIDHLAEPQLSASRVARFGSGQSSCAWATPKLDSMDAWRVSCLYTYENPLRNVASSIFAINASTSTGCFELGSDNSCSFCISLHHLNGQLCCFSSDESKGLAGFFETIMKGLTHPSNSDQSSTNGCVEQQHTSTQIAQAVLWYLTLLWQFCHFC